MTKQQRQIAGCLIVLVVLVAGAMAASRWLDGPSASPSRSFDVMLDSASEGLKTHPCATDPHRACMSLSIRGMPLETP